MKDLIINQLPYLDLTTEVLPNEYFIDIYDGYYSVSNLGRIRSNERLDAKGRRIKQRFRKQIIKYGHLNFENKKTESRQLCIVLCVDGKKINHLIKPLVGSLFIGSKTKRECYASKNSQWDDNRAENIIIKTFSESIKNSYTHGRSTRTISYLYKNMETGEKFSIHDLVNHPDYNYNTIVGAAKKKIKRYGCSWKRVKNSAAKKI